MKKCLLITVVMLPSFGADMALGQQTVLRARQDVSDQAIQRKIAELVRSVSPRSDEENQRLLEGLDRLREELGKNAARLVPQIVIFQRKTKDERAAFKCEFLLTELSRVLSKDEIIAAVAPYLRSEDPKIKRRIANILHRICSGEPRVDFLPIFRFLKDYTGIEESGIQDELVEYMFRTSPGAALLTFVNVLGIDRRNLLWAEHLISDTVWKQQHGFLKASEVESGALDELEKLSRHREWWVRLYAAEILRAHRAFRRQDIIDRLKQDKNPLVRRSLASAAGQ